ncbi:hypothetical protein KBB41_03030 [Candidatus Curtissbacteria bacterium]|nr:hypothetical protein [Candidatus Curtissbacteria bacterium]
MIFNIGKIVDKIALSLGFERVHSHNVRNSSRIDGAGGNTVQQAQTINNAAGSEETISDLELSVLKYLYQNYKSAGTNQPISARELHSELDLSDGTDLSILHDSSFVGLDSEAYKLNPAGIRFMDSFVRKNKPEIDITSLAHSGGHRGQELTGLRLINNGPCAAIGIKCYLCADGLESINFANIDRLNSNEESKASLGFVYSNTPFFTEVLKELRIEFRYKNKDGFAFISGRYLSQQERADGNFNILNAPLGEYFVK